MVCKRPLLTAAQKNIMLQWVKAPKQEILEHLKTIIWSDESRFCLWTMLADVFNKDPMELLRNIVCKMWFRLEETCDVLEMCWSCFNYIKLSSLVDVTKNFNQNSFSELLEKQVLLFVIHLSEKIEHFTTYLWGQKIPPSPDQNRRLYDTC